MIQTQSDLCSVLMIILHLTTLYYNVFKLSDVMLHCRFEETHKALAECASGWRKAADDGGQLYTFPSSISPAASHHPNITSGN